MRKVLLEKFSPKFIKDFDQLSLYISNGYYLVAQNLSDSRQAVIDEIVYTTADFDEAVRYMYQVFNQRIDGQNRDLSSA